MQYRAYYSVTHVMPTHGIFKTIITNTFTYRSSYKYKYTNTNTTTDLVRRLQIDRRRITMSGTLKTIKPEQFESKSGM